MRLNKNFFYTFREDVKSEDSTSGKLLVRSGMIKKTGNGLYSYHPLGYRIIRKIEGIVREEMDRAGATELIMPSLLPEDYYIKTERLDVFGKGIFRLKDRFNRGYLLGPTHEELFAVSAKEAIQSYKDLPFNLYQIGRKYRDEPRPRYGLIRIREFIMKDAYSFDVDLAGLDVAYMKMFNAYKIIFDRIGLNYKIVTADTGAMGGILSEEFQAIADIGEDTIVLCDSCSYASNIEVSACVDDDIEKEEELEKEEIYTPNAGTIEEVTALMGLPSSKFVKTLIYKSGDNLYACMVRADRDVNETKVVKLLGVTELEMAEAEDVIAATNAKVGYAGPVGLKIPVVIDSEVLKMSNFIVGANKSDYHFKNVNVKDFEYFKSGDIKNIKEGDRCPICSGHVFFKKGIEIGNTFKLGDKYAKSLDVLYKDANNQLIPVQMGSYGIGIERIMTSVVEQNNDKDGIIWPMNIAPFQVALVLIDGSNKEQSDLAEKIYAEFNKNKIEVIFDDRDERPGIKFKDMDLIGIPIKITVGKKADKSIVELNSRDGKISEEVSFDNLTETVQKIIEERLT